MLLKRSVTAQLLGLVVLLAAASSGCGAATRPTTTFAPSDSYGYGASAASAGDLDPLAPHPVVEGEYTCPARPNVVPDYDYNLDGTDNFTVCTSSQSAYRVQVHGSTETSDTICAFPIQYVDESHVFIKPDAFGNPMYKCVRIEDGQIGALFNFDLTTYNALFIVEGTENSANRTQMSSCLKLKNYGYCPHFSYGRFR